MGMARRRGPVALTMQREKSSRPLITLVKKVIHYLSQPFFHLT